jgi:hypothetical protein
MEAHEARDLKPGQWVLVRLAGGDTASNYTIDIAEAEARRAQREARFRESVDWQIVQQAVHGGLIVYCADPFAHYAGSGVQKIYRCHDVLLAGPMVNKPALTLEEVQG